ncbi:hypothetical protein FRC01_013967, partial [Tulasnella sp. 417]
LQFWCDISGNTLPCITTLFALHGGPTHDVNIYSPIYDNYVEYSRMFDLEIEAGLAAGTSSALALLPDDRNADAEPGKREETKREKKERKRQVQEAKMTPEERRLAQVMGRYGSGGDAFGGMSMDYARKDKQKEEQGDEK